MSDRPRFRLFDLPGELVEDISIIFFDMDEAYRLLTVSRAFYTLFARRVWRTLDPRVFALSEPTLSKAMARYGRLVRYIDLDDELCSAINPDIKNSVNVFDVLSVFSGVTTLIIWDDHELLASNGIKYKDIIMCFPHLYKLECRIEEDKEPYNLVTLASAINHRQSNHSISPIEYLNLLYLAKNIDNPWTRLASFVQMILDHSVLKIEITPWTSTRIRPSQSQLQILSKYFIQYPNMDKREDTRFCYATLNRSWVWKPNDLLSSHVYPQLRQLFLRTCCMSSDTYDYSDFIPSNFPHLRSITINGHECNIMVSDLYPPAWKKLLLQNWPYLNELKVSANITCEQLVDTLKYNCRLTRLHIWLHPKMLDENNTFNLASILPLLLRVQQLSIIGKNEMKLDYSPDYDDYYILTRSQINVTQFSGFALSSRMFKLLYSLPRLVTISVRWCKFYSTGVIEATNMYNLINDPYDIDMVDYDDVYDDCDDEDAALYIELMASLYTISAKHIFNNPCIIKEFNLNIREDDYAWPLDVTLEMIALMPKLQALNSMGEIGDIPNAVKARFPHIDVEQLFDFQL
ncbi:hypothetical protein GQ42DRAFT_34753 [Ramicandelaber brevisporus]|nr:hypothetical protein GQ42DRAFT_34753 [Ramicandelaber brevisporus]